MYDAAMFPETVSQHHANVRRLRCVVTDRPNVSLHHAQGGSVRGRLSAMGYDPAKSLNQRGSGSEALVIPLAAELHYFGMDAIDGHIGRRTWEDKYGAQADHLDDVGRQLGYSLWELFRLWAPEKAIIRPSGSAGPVPST